MTAVRFPDAQRAVRDVARALLAGRPEPEARDVTVSTRLPDDKSDEAPRLPYVAVRSDGTFRDARLNGRATVRVSVWHLDEGLGVDLATLLEGLLLAYSGDEVRAVSSVVGPIPTADPDTGDPLTFFTVTAYLRPVAITP